MEYVEGTELRVYIDKLHRRPPAERYGRARGIGVALCEALVHLHSRGLVHRDIKPTNVLIADDGRVILSDLGIVQRDGDAEPRHGTLVGTPAYAAPEQALGGRVDPRADLFGLGATLYHILTRRRPFDGIEGRDELPPRPSSFDPGIPTDLEAVVLRLLAPDPAHRYRSADLVRGALAAGRDEGVQVAGRQDALAAAAHGLRRAEAGVKVWMLPVGPQGAGRGWLSRVIASSARRRGIPCLTVEEETSAERIDRLLQSSKGAVFVVIQATAEPVDGVEVVEIPLPPLGAADVRRTVVGFAPHTPEAAQVSARLHRLSGGLPALLVPMLQTHTTDQKVVLPEEVGPPTVARTAFDNLAEDACSVAATLALLDRPASSELLSAVVGPTAEMALNDLAMMGIVTCVEGQSVLSAGVFRGAALAAHPDLATLEAQVEAVRLDDPTVPGAALHDLCREAERHLQEGRLRAALDAAARASELATAMGEHHLECHARATWGLVLLETGFPKSARRCLADATALARAVGDRNLRHRTHLLRAWAELDERPGDLGAAAAALDRLMPLVTDLPVDLSDPLGAFTCTLWARSAAGLRDQGTWRRAAAAAAPRIAAQSGVVQARLLLLLAEGAQAVSDRTAGRLIAEATAAAAGLPLHAWWGACLQARADKTAAPIPDRLIDMLQPNEVEALERRGRNVGR
jgi:hypothetical protein